MKLKKLLSIGLVAVMTLLATSVNIFAEESRNNSTYSLTEKTTSNKVVINGSIGTVYDLGNGVMCEVISQERYDQITEKVNEMSRERSKNIFIL